MKLMHVTMGTLAITIAAWSVSACSGPAETCDTNFYAMPGNRKGHPHDICCPATYANEYKQLTSIYNSGVGSGKYVFDTSCHPCVAEVCKKRPECCSTEWHSDKDEYFFYQCADIVDDICPIECYEEDTVCCPFIGGYGNRSVFIPYSDGHFGTLCHPWVTKVCSVMPECCETAWTEVCVDAISKIAWDAKHPCGGQTECASVGTTYSDPIKALDACSNCATASLECNDVDNGLTNLCFGCAYAELSWSEDQAQGTCNGAFCHVFENGGTCVLK